MKDIIIWAILLFIFLIISGLYVSEYTQLDTKKYNYQPVSINEYFNNPHISSISNQKEEIHKCLRKQISKQPLFQSMLHPPF